MQLFTSPYDNRWKIQGLSFVMPQPVNVNDHIKRLRIILPMQEHLILKMSNSSNSAMWRNAFNNTPVYVGSWQINIGHGHTCVALNWAINSASNHSVMNDMLFFFFFYLKAWLCKCAFNHPVLPPLCWYFICMQPLSLLARRRAEVHIIVIPRALLWIFQRDATHLRENSDQYRWINQCFGISQRKPALSSKGGTC